ncbi:MAG: DUF502 domain-containing protein [Porticoccaceae bacterium]
MKRSFKRVLQGLATVLPLGLTLYFIFWLLSWVEAQSKPLLLLLIPEHLYLPGMGILATVVALFLIGLLVNAYVIRILIGLGERLLARIPLVKSVFGAIQDVMRVVSLGDRKSLGSVVAIDLGNDTRLIGFLTGNSVGNRLFGTEGGERVGVYLPMSYQIGGFTLYVTPDRLTKLDIGFEEAMRIAITGGVQNDGKAKASASPPGPSPDQP